jgi:hypothetical protein
MKDLIAAEIKAAKSAPKDMPAPLAKAVQDYNKGAYGSAILAAQKLAETPAAEDKGGVAEKAKQLTGQWNQQLAARIERLKYMRDNAMFSEADAEVASLKTALKGAGELETKLAEHAERLAAEDTKVPREAAKALERVLAVVNTKGPDDKTLKELKKLAEKYPGTRPADRAARLARLLEKKPSH